MFSKILIANRGEIAIRIIRACKEMGIKTVAIYSEADKNALHTILADESVCVGSPSVKDSYLNIPAIISAAVVTEAQAIHPGYGLLSENFKFAELCKACNIEFIGPSANIIKQMGDKDEARKTMKKAGVPVILGSEVVTSVKDALKIAREITFPLLIKARAGGGGKGIRLVNKESEFENAFLSASSEAKLSFGDGALYMEKYLTNVKHIEMQILADNYGNVVCLGERDCSVQRKNQKLIEESPSTVLNDEQRNKMIDICKKAVKYTKYRNAGTIEFLYDQSGNFYFMEMNTRLQVEHTVTEMVTGIDIVKWQIRIADGVKLTFSQQDVVINGHSIECRINAENPKNNFCPSCGIIETLHISGGPFVRFDTAIYQGYEIPPFYDSMIGKLIVHEKTREDAIRKMKASLCELVIDGVENNIDYQIELLDNKDFVNGTFYTNLLTKINIENS